MTIIRYTNTLPYSYDANHPRSHYLINGQKAYKNRGELCESIAKHHRGIYTDINPNTSWDTGSDIENEFAPQYMNIRGKGDLIKTLKKNASVFSKNRKLFFTYSFKNFYLGRP